MGPRVVVAPRVGVGVVGGGFHTQRAVVRGPVVRTNVNVRVARSPMGGGVRMGGGMRMGGGRRR